VRHRDRVRIARTENGLYRVQRARPDVPEDNSEGTERESPLRASPSAHAQSIRLPCHQLVRATLTAGPRRTPIGKDSPMPQWHHSRCDASGREPALTAAPVIVDVGICLQQP